MPTLTIEGRQVNVDDSFTSLTPDQQNATVDEISKSMPSVWGGRLKQAGVALAKGVIGMPGSIGDLRELGGFVAEKLGADKSTGENAVANMPVPLIGALSQVMPSSKQIKETIEPYTGKFREPGTNEEKYIDTIGQFIPATIGPGGVVREGVNAAIKYGPTAVKYALNALKYGAVPGATSEFAGQKVEGTKAEPWVRGAAALASGGTVAAASGLLSRPAAAARTIRGAIPEGITAQQLDAAEQLFQEAHAAGQPITRAEAVQHVTQGGTSLANVQRIVEGQGELRPMMSDRAAANEAAVSPVLDTIAPPTTNNPSMIGHDIGEAATKTIKDIEGARTRAVDPLYEAASHDKVPAKEMRGFVKDIDKQIKADKTGIFTDSLQEVRDLLTKQKRQTATPAEVILHDASVPEPFATANPVKEVIPGTKRKNELLHNDIESLDTIRKYVRDKMELPQYGADATTKTQGALVMKLLDGLRQKMMDASPNFQQAKELYEDITKRYLNPLLAGPIGKLAKEDITTQNAIKVLFPAKEILPGSENEVFDAVRALAVRNLPAAKQLVRAHVEMTFNDAAKNGIKGANEFGGAKFAAAIRGNSQQRKNLEAAIGALPNGTQINEGLDRFLNFVEAQGQRQAIGSQTAFNQEVLQDLRRGTPIQEAGNAVLTGGLKLPARIKETLDRWRLGRGTEEIADLLTSPSTSGRFKAIAQMPPGSEQARRVMLKLVLAAGQGARSGRE